MLVNKKLRLALDVGDRAVLFAHAVDSLRFRTAGSIICSLPSGRIARLTRADNFPAEMAANAALFHVHLNDRPAVHMLPAIAPSRPLRGIVGSSASWRRSCDEILRCVREQRWVVVRGETGTGRCEALIAATAEMNPASQPRVFRPDDFADLTRGEQELANALDHERFEIILRDVDALSEPQLALIADLLDARQHDGWVGATIGCAEHEANEHVGALVLPLFGHTVSVPALRHRIEDLAELVPHLLRQLNRGGELELSSEAMQQLRKYTWPGNVEQLRHVLRDVVQRQRSGVIQVSQLPPICRAVSRHTLTQIEALERDAIVRSLEESNGNKKAAAAALGISRATIYRKIKEFGITA